MKKLYSLIILFISTITFLSAQSTINITTSGGSYTSEKWVSITTAINGGGTLVWGQNNCTSYTSSSCRGLINQDISIAPGTYYVNCYDSFSDGWDGTSISVTAYGNTLASGSPTNASLPGNLEASYQIVVVAPPSCLPPTSLASANVTATSADISWTAGGSETAWEIEYGVDGFTATGSGTSASTTTASLTGLTANTSYDFYVRATCSATDQSPWTGPYSFTTTCSSYSGSYTQNFDGTTAPAIDACWSNIIVSSSTYPWIKNEASAFDPQRSAPNSIEFYCSSASVGDMLYFISPEFSDLDNTKRVKFHVQDEGSIYYIGDLAVGIMSDPTDITTFTPLDTVFDSELSNSWLEVTVNFDTYTGTGKYVALAYIVNGTYDYMYVDDFTYESIPSCTEPALTSLASANVTATSADISWTAGGSETAWEIEYGVDGFTATGSGTSASTTTASLTGLTANTSYDFYVRATCSATDQSPWVGPYSFTTPCSSYTGSYTQNFDGTTAPAIDGCWNPIVTTASASYTITTYASTSNAPFSSPNSIRMYNGSATGTTTMLLASPEFSDFGNTKRIKFQAKTATTSSFHTSGLIVGTMSDPNDATTFTAFQTIANSTIQGTNWVEVIVSFSSYTGTDKYIGLKHDLNDAFDAIYIDNFVYESIPACPEPALTSLASANVTANSADISWTAGGTETAWEIEYGVTGFTATGSGTSASATTASLTGLTANTSHDFYVRATCSATEQSLWVGPFNFTTGPSSTSIPSCLDFELGLGATASLNAGSNATASVFTIISPPNSGVELTGVGSSANTWTGNSSITTEAQAWGNTDHHSNIELNVDATGESSVSLTFDLKQTYSFGSVYSWFRVTVNGTQIGASINPTTAGADPYVNQSYDLSAYAGTNFNLKLEHSGKYSSAYYGNGDHAYVDNVCLSAPTCTQPSALVATNLTSNSVDISWTAGGTETAWNIEYGPAPYTQGSGGTSVALTSSTTSLTLLDAYTNYNFYVQADCGSGDESDWSTFSFTTTGPGDCSSSVAYTYSSNSTLASSLRGFVANTPGDYITLTFTAGSTESGYDYWFINDAADGTGNTIATGDGFITSSNGGIFESTTGEISFYVISDASVTGTPFAFTASCAAPPPCIAPTSITASNLTSSSADLSWTAGGTETAWNYEYGPDGFTQGSGTSLPLSAANVSITSLTEYTDYDFYVQADCGRGLTSPWSGPYSFSTTGPGDCSSSVAYTYSSNSTLASSLRGFVANTPGDYITLTFTAGETESGYDYWFINDAADGTGNTIATGDGFITSSNGGIFESTTGEISFYVISDASVTGTPFAFTASCVAPPPCPDVTNVLASNITNNSADISWTGSAAAVTYNLEYGTVGFTPGTGNSSSISGSTTIASQSSLFLSGNNTWPHVYPLALTSGGASTQAPQTITINVTSLPAGGTNWRLIKQNQTTGASFVPSGSAGQPLVLGLNTLTAPASTWNRYVKAQFKNNTFEFDSISVNGTSVSLGVLSPSSSTSLTGLTADTQYDVYLQSNCGNTNGVSDTTGPYTFTTECDIVATFPYTMDFENGFGCWDVVDIDGGNSWGTFLNQGINSSIAAGIAYDFNQHDDYLISPKFSVTTASSRFSFNATDAFNYPESFEFLVSTTGKAAADFTDTIISEVASGGYSYYQYDLSSFIGQDIYVSIHSTSTYQYYLFVDDVTIDEFFSKTVIQSETSCDSYTWSINGTSYTSDTSLTVFSPAVDVTDADSTYILNLTVNSSTSSTETITACDSLVWNGNTYFASNSTATASLLTSSGCDSIVTLNLTINNSSVGIETVVACDSSSWNGTTYTTSGNYSLTGLTNNVNCDSTSNLVLTVNYSSSSLLTTTACNTFTWKGSTFTSSGVYVAPAGTNFSGCPQVDSLDLTITTIATSNTQTACDSYSWNGNPYTTSGTYYSSSACVDTLYLTVNASSSSSSTVAACDSSVWNGITYFTSGTYNVFTTNAAGCDSTATLNLTVGNSATNSVTVSECDSYNWNGTTYTSSGVYSGVFQTSTGCDSTVNLVLTINSSSNQSVTVFSCDEYVWDGVSYTASGDYTNNYTTASGCDSTVTLVLTLGTTAAPFTEGFDINFPNCWSQPDSADGEDALDWTRNSFATPSQGTGPSDDVIGGGHYMYIESSLPAQHGDNAVMYTNMIDISSLSAPELRFFSHMYGSSIGSLTVELIGENDTVPTTIFSKSGDHGDLWVQERVVFSSTSNFVKFRITGTLDSNSVGAVWAGDMAIDQFGVREAIPNDLALVAANVNSDCELTSAEPIELWVVNNGIVDQANFKLSYSINGGSQVLDSIITFINIGDTLRHTFSIPADMSMDGIYDIDFACILAIDADVTDNVLNFVAENYTNPADAVTEGDTICFVGDFGQISAIGDGWIYWYDSLVGGSLVGENDTLYVTPSATTSYFAEVSVYDGFEEDFESYSPGDLIAQTSNDWNSWSDPNGGADDDAEVTDFVSSGGSNSLYLNDNNSDDIVLPLGNTYSSGTFNFETDMYIETEAYLNFQEGVVNGEAWAFDLYFTDTVIIVEIDDSIVLTVAYNPNNPLGAPVWFNFSLEANLDAGQWRMSKDGIVIGSFSMGDAISSVNFWASTGNNYYIDNVKWSAWGGDACRSLSRTEAVVVLDSCNTTSVSEVSFENLKIYPNPNNGSFTIANSELINSVVIMDLQGKVVYRNDILNLYNLNVNLENLDRGMYMINIISENEITTKSIIIN